VKSGVCDEFRANRHYSGKPSNNAIALKAGKHRWTRRRRVMSIRKVTFQQMQVLCVEQITQIGDTELPGQKSIPNLTSGLGDFIQDIGFKWSDPVGPIFRTAFEDMRDAHLQRLIEAGRSRPYVKNRAWLLNVWHRFLLRLDYEGASITGDLNPLQEKLRPLVESVRSVRKLAAEIGVCDVTLRSWILHGRIPHRRNEVHLERLETYFCLEPGALLGTLPHHRHKTAECTAPTIEFREQMKKWSVSRYKLKPRNVPTDHPLREQWVRVVLREKVEGSSSGLISTLGSVLSSAFMRSDANSWRTRPMRSHWNEPKMLAKKWPQILDGLRVPSADRVFGAIASYLGWLLLKPDDGGMGLNLSEISLGLLVDRERLLKYLDWITARAGQINGGHQYFIHTILMFLHPKDGLLVNHPELGVSLGYDPSAWRERCAVTYEWLAKELLPAVANGYKKQGMSRKPFIPLAPILELDRPLDAIIRGLNKAESARPTTGAEHEVAWARDNALIALLASNPLRLENLINMTYRPDNTGHIRQTATGEWRIFISKHEFKNPMWGANDSDYDHAIDPAVVPFLVRYLRTYRPLLGGSRPELIFVSTDHPDREFDGLDKRVREWTKKYLPGVHSFGPHAFRHIVATHIIKVTNGNYVLAALVLRDSPRTVERHYAHLLRRYADCGCQEAFADSMSQLKTDSRSFKGTRANLPQLDAPQMAQTQAGPDGSAPAQSSPEESAARQPSGENPAGAEQAAPTSARRARDSEESLHDRQETFGKSRPTEQDHFSDSGIPDQGGCR